MVEPHKNSPYQLIVEGPDDRAFFGAFQERMQKAGLIDERAWIKAVGGVNYISEWRDTIEGFLARPNPPRAIGLVRDADEDPAAAFQSLRDLVAGIEGLPVPERAGEFAEAGGLRLGILVLPPDRPGTRETVCLQAVADEPVMDCVESYLACVQETGIGLHSEDKSRLQAFLAAQEHADSRTGIAINRGLLPWDCPAFAVIHAFLQALHT